MADERKPVSMEELAFSNMWELEGLVMLLEKQKLIPREELLEEIKTVQVRAQVKRKEN